MPYTTVATLPFLLSPSGQPYNILVTRGYSQKNWVGVCSMLPKTLTLD